MLNDVVREPALIEVLLDRNDRAPTPTNRRLDFGGKAGIKGDGEFSAVFVNPEPNGLAATWEDIADLEDVHAHDDTVADRTQILH